MTTSSAAPLLSLQNASVGYGKKVVLEGLEFTIHAGEYFGLVGPNGSGKTTVLRTMLGRIPPLAGTVKACGSGGGPLRIGYVPQRDTIDNVLPYTVDEVVMMGRYRQIGLVRRAGPRDREAVVRSLAHVAMGALHDRPFRALSGGQKQRVLIARALASEPELLVLDEPTNGMDLTSRLSILDLISDLHRQSGLAIVMVSHLLDDVANHVQRLGIVEKSRVQVGSVDTVLTSENLTALYGIPVRVTNAGDRTIIIAGEHHGAA